MADTSRASTVIKPPPRLTGDAQADAEILNSWLWEFFQAAVIQSGLLDPKYQATDSGFDPDNLPDPTNSTIAKAQRTANEAYTLAKSLVP